MGVEQGLADAGVVDLRLYVHPVLQQPPVGLGDQLQVVAGDGDLGAALAPLALRVLGPRAQEVLVRALPAAPGGATPHARRAAGAGAKARAGGVALAGGAAGGERGAGEAGRHLSHGGAGAHRRHGAAVVCAPWGGEG